MSGTDELTVRMTRLGACRDSNLHDKFYAELYQVPPRGYRRVKHCVISVPADSSGEDLVNAAIRILRSQSWHEYKREAPGR